MVKFSKPILFSKYFGISPNILESEGLIDSFLNVDTPLFIDPILIHKSSFAIINNDAYIAFKNYINDIIRLLTISEKTGDAAWKAAFRKLDLDEPLSNGLGYGQGERHGASRPDYIRIEILKTLQEIIQLGSKDPEMISLMSFFEENVGADTISDLTTKIIEPFLAKITESFCIENGIPTKKTKSTHGVGLPHFLNSKSKERAIILIPKDIVRSLPIASEWSDLQYAIDENNELRNRVNLMLATIIKPTISDKKYILRKVALESSDMFNKFLDAVKSYADSYDPNEDALGYYKMKELISSIPISFWGVNKKYELSKGIDEVYKMVIDSINVFKRHIETGNLWEELWLNNKPKRERAAQLIYYAIADGYCRAFNIDISPETNMGGGAVDFKFSLGYEIKIVVEMKRSGGQVEHGYSKQLEAYKKASQTQRGIFVVLDFGDGSTKIRRIKLLRKKLIDNGEDASEIIVIDARRKKTASKID